MRKLFKAFAMVTVISTVTRLISFVFKIYLSRMLGAEILGLYQISVSLLSLLACFGASGLPTTLSRMLAEKEALGDTRGEQGIFSTCLIVSMICCGIIITVFIAFPKLLTAIFTDERCAYIFIVMLPMLITSTLYAVIRGWFWGKKDFFVFSVSEFFDEILKIILTVTLLSGALFTVKKMYAYAIAMLVGDVLLITGLIVTFFVKGGRLARPAFGRQIARSAAPLTVTRVFGSLMSTFLSLAIPAMLVRHAGLSSAEATAEFGRAGGMVMPLIFTPGGIVGSLAVVLIPEIASKNNAANRQRLGNKISDSIKFACVVSCLFFAIFTAVGKNLAAEFYDDARAGEFLERIAVLMLPMCLNGLIVSVLNSLGKEPHTFASHLTGCVFLVAVAVWTPRYIGIYAYFLALGVFHCVSLLFNFVILLRNSQLNKKALWQGAGCIAFSVPLALSARLLAATLTPHIGIWGAIVVTCLAIGALFLPFLLLTKTLDLSLFLPRRPAAKAHIPRR